MSETSLELGVAPPATVVDDSTRQMFAYSIVHLFLLFALMLVDRAGGGA